MTGCIVEFNDEQYIPVRAIPFVTGNYIKPSSVPKLLAGNDIYFSASSYRMLEDNLELVAEREWLGIGPVEKFDDLPAGIVIKLKDLNRVIFELYQAPLLPIDPDDPIRHEAFSIPNTGALLSEQQLKQVMAGLTMFSSSRRNSGDAKRKRILDAFQAVQSICEIKNVKFTRDHIPGQKFQLYKCLQLIEPDITMELSTFGGKEYAGKLGLRWKQGEKHKMGESMVDAVNAYLKTK